MKRFSLRFVVENRRRKPSESKKRKKVGEGERKELLCFSFLGTMKINFS
jgi:hypothetical protein